MGERTSLESRLDPQLWAGENASRTDPAQEAGSERIGRPADARDRCCGTGRVCRPCPGRSSPGHRPQGSSQRFRQSRTTASAARSYANRPRKPPRAIVMN
jgi:hypothetical protein